MYGTVQMTIAASPSAGGAPLDQLAIIGAVYWGEDSGYGPYSGPSDSSRFRSGTGIRAMVQMTVDSPRESIPSVPANVRFMRYY